MSEQHYNTNKGYPQNRYEVEQLSDDELAVFMGECSVEPADFDACLSCYAYLILQKREEATRSKRFKLEFTTDNAVFGDGTGEVLWLLDGLRESVSRGAIEGKVINSNGNTIGEWSWQ